MDELELLLRYRRAPGRLAPYFDGLAVGVARATRCPACSRRWFPPRLVCTCHHATLEWITLPGTGLVRAATATSILLPGEDAGFQAVFAWIAMDGADNLALGRIEAAGGAIAGRAVRLVADAPSRAGHAWCARFEVGPPG